MGGVGKTAVAIEYAHMFRSEYELVWWIPADQPALVRSSLAALADLIGLSRPARPASKQRPAAALDALRRGEPVLALAADLRQRGPAGGHQRHHPARPRRRPDHIAEPSLGVSGRYGAGRCVQPGGEHRLPDQAGAAGDQRGRGGAGWPRNSVTCRWPWSRRARCRPRPGCRSMSTCGC